MIVSRSMMLAQLMQMLNSLNATTTLYLYDGAQPSASTIRTSGFVHNNYSAQLLGSVTYGANQFRFTYDTTNANKWVMHLITGNFSGTVTRAGTPTFGVLAVNTSSPMRSIVTSVGVADSSIIRLDNMTLSVGTPVVFQTFNLTIERNTAL